MTPAAAGELSRVIGSTERTMGALLRSILQPRGVTFVQWTVLACTHAGAVPLALVRHLHRSHRIVSADEETNVSLRDMVNAGLVTLTGPSTFEDLDNFTVVSLTSVGQSLFGELRKAVEHATGALTDGLAQADVAATLRVLQEMRARAAQRLDQATEGERVTSDSSNAR